ncbi:hypothetical protein Aduo_013303 [Ancylostoma duodenale]
MHALVLLCFILTLSTVTCDQAKINVNEPITLTISPKIWNLLETKADIINDAMKSITFVDFRGKESAVRYKVRDGKVNHFSVPKSGASFQDFNNGVHLSMKGVQFGASFQGRADVGRRILPILGEIRAKSESANLNIVLAWNDFKFVPSMTMDSNVRVEFTRNLGRLKFLTNRIQEMVTSKVNSEVPKKIIETIEQQVNPRLQKLREVIMSMGYKEYDMGWTVQNNILRVAVKPKSGSGVVSPLISIDHMLCVNANMLAVLDAFQFRLKSTAVTNGIQFTCVSPKFNCEGTSCSMCSDLDANPAPEGSGDKFHNCLPTSRR